MASTALVGVQGGLSPSLFVPSTSSSNSASSSSLRAGGKLVPRRLGRRLVVPRRGAAEGDRITRWNCWMLRCADEVNVVAEDEVLDDATDDEMDPDAGTKGTADADGVDELESSSLNDAPVEWIKQQPLPYPSDALEPYISKETVEQHWGVHQQMHVERLNSMIGGSEWEGMSLGQMMLSSFNEGREQPHPPFFHAAQIWNHDFYWRSMEPGGGGKPPERLLKFINRDFGSYDGMIQQFMDAALTQFGETEQITNVSEYEKHCFSSVLQIYQCLYGCLHQVYKDRNMVRQLVQRAEMAGFKAIALTVDTPKPALFQLCSFVMYQTNDSGLASYVCSQIDRSLCWKV